MREHLVRARHFRRELEVDRRIGLVVQFGRLVDAVAHRAGRKVELVVRLELDDRNVGLRVHPKGMPHARNVATERRDHLVGRHLLESFLLLLTDDGHVLGLVASCGLLLHRRTQLEVVDQRGTH